MVQLEDSHKKMSEQLQVVHAGLAQKDKYIEELEAKLKVRNDKDLTLNQSVTKVARAVFGKQLDNIHPVVVETTFCLMLSLSMVCFVL